MGHMVLENFYSGVLWQRAFNGQESGSPRENALEAVPLGSRRNWIHHIQGISRAIRISENNLPNPRVGKVAVYI